MHGGNPSPLEFDAVTHALIDIFSGPYASLAPSLYFSGY